MSLQEHLNQEAEFIASIVAEERHMSWMCANGKHGNADRREPFTYEGTCARTLKFADGHTEDCMCQCHDRRDDITKPNTTYGFPPATLNW